MSCELNTQEQANYLIYLIYHIFPSTQRTSLSLPLHVLTYQVIFRRTYEPRLVTICLCAFGIPDGLQCVFAYNVIPIGIPEDDLLSRNM